MGSAVGKPTNAFGGAKLKGVFSSPATVDASVASSQGKLYWFARPAELGAVSVQLLDENHLPTARRRLVSQEDFLELFTPEPELTYRLLTQRVAQGDTYREQGQNIEAKIEYLQALKVDEENIRANFGLGLAYLALNQLEKGRYALEKLAALDETFSPEHKHLFNEFGISLRKKGLYDEALSYYGRAKSLCPDDEHLLLNIARAWLEKGDPEQSWRTLRDCLALAPDFREALAFFSYLRRQGAHPRDKDLDLWFDHFSLKRGELGRLLDEQ
ncbi:tetratricopeptide repeat protein [Fundidesulfovibrio butyratiphilus]